MTAERLLIVGNVAAIVGLIWFGWWLTRPGKSRRGGYIADRWKD